MSEHLRTLRTIRRAVRRVTLTIIAIAIGMFLYFVCQGMFSGYPQYGTNILSHIGLVLTSAVGGIVWILDHRRIRNDDE